MIEVFLVALAIGPTGTESVSAARCEERTRVEFADFERTAGSRDPEASTLSKPLIAVGPPYSETWGDFDGDGAQDVALLLRSKKNGKLFAIAACLSTRPALAPELIPEAYTPGALVTTPKGTEYHEHTDDETPEDGVYELDGIGSYCCECCGATYIWRKGVFVQVIDSD